MTMRWLAVPGALLAAALVYLLLPAGVDELQRRAAAILVVAAVFWALEVVPLFATSLGVVLASIILLAQHGGLAREGDIRFTVFLEPFASDIIMLFLGGLMISAAASKHGLARAIAGWVLRPFTRHPLALIYAVLAITAVLSMWMSNTATTAMMLAIVAPLIARAPEGDRYGIGLTLAVPMGANIGGIGTPIGTPPNAIALAALRDAGIDLSFLQWMIMAIPLAAVLLAIAGPIIYALHRPTDRAWIDQAAPEAQPLSLQGGLTLLVLLMAIAGWLTGPVHGVADGVIALLAGTTLVFLGLLNANDTRGIEWNVLILMWGGLALGVAMQQTGLVELLTQWPIEGLPRLALVAAVMAAALALSTFISNTATAALIVPIVLALSVPSPERLVIVAALACSFAMAMPVSTPPNALAFSTGRLTVAQLVKVGVVLSVVSYAVTLAGHGVVLPLVLG
jgi:sodium-dependent dicarboxylate transporter 2/3/5